MPVHVYTLKFWEKITFYHFSKKRLFSVFLHIEAQLSLKNAWLPPVFFLDFNSPWYDLLVSHSHYLGKKYFPLVGTVLNPPWSASSCLKWSLNTSYPCKRNTRVWQGKLTLGRTHKLIPPLIDMLQYLETIFPSVESLWSSLQDEVYFMGYIFSSRVCIYNCLVFSQPLPYLYQAMQNTENVFYCLNIIEDLQFGVEWQGWWLFDVTPSFRWENAHYIYQMVGLGSTNFFRNLGIACLLYTNDRLYGESFATEDYWSRPSIEQDELTFTVHLGYFLGLKKCMFVPATIMVCLGMLVESVARAFSKY